jgi:hypothetical protein
VRSSPLGQQLGLSPGMLNHITIGINWAVALGIQKTFLLTNYKKCKINYEYPWRFESVPAKVVFFLPLCIFVGENYHGLGDYSMADRNTYSWLIRCPICATCCCDSHLNTENLLCLSVMSINPSQFLKQSYKS